MESRPPQLDFNAVTGWITRAAAEQGEHLREEVQRRLGVGHRRAKALLREGVNLGWLQPQLAADGQGRGYRPGALRQLGQTYALAGLQEDLPWRRDFAPFLELPPAVTPLLGQAFSELLNNAIEHSGGTQVSVSVRQSPQQVQLLVADDGLGLFEHLRETVALEDPVLALLELSKGRLTSQPLHHCGHGLFLSARLADVFHLQANGEAWLSRGAGHAASQTGWRRQRLGPGRQGTSVYLSISCNTTRTLDGVLDDWRADAVDFSRAQVPLRLLVREQGCSMLHSRADARRVTHRLTEFALAELDFDGIQALGPAFADELLRVWASSHPHVELKCLHAAPQVMRTLQRAAASAALGQPFAVPSR